MVSTKGLQMRPVRQSRLRNMLKELENPPEIQVTLEDKLVTFLESLAECGNIGDACRDAQVTRKTVHTARKNPDFEKLYQQHLDLGISAIEDEATKRATVGTLEPVFWKGRRVASVRKKSDLLLMFVLKARRPELYRDTYNAPPADYGDAEIESPRQTIASRIARISNRASEK
jgi:hypothetical protein